MIYVVLGENKQYIVPELRSRYLTSWPHTKFRRQVKQARLPKKPAVPLGPIGRVIAI